MNQFRLVVKKNGDTIQTPWVNEAVKHGPHAPHTAVVSVADLRAHYGPAAAIAIERRGESRIPNLQKLTRAMIKDGSDTYYSRWFEEGEVEQKMNEIHTQWPKAQITTEVRNV